MRVAASADAVLMLCNKSTVHSEIAVFGLLISAKSIGAQYVGCAGERSLLCQIQVQQKNQHELGVAPRDTIRAHKRGIGELLEMLCVLCLTKSTILSYCIVIHQFNSTRPDTLSTCMPLCQRS